MHDRNVLAAVRLDVYLRALTDNTPRRGFVVSLRLDPELRVSARISPISNKIWRRYVVTGDYKRTDEFSPR